MKILKRLIKCESNDDEKYIIVHKLNPYREYDFMRCDEKKLKKMLIDNVMTDYHIFLAKDELKIETDFQIEEE